LVSAGVDEMHNLKRKERRRGEIAKLIEKSNQFRKVKSSEGRC